MNKYYVYIYHSEDGVPYYVGKGSGNRITQHISAARNGKSYPLADKIRSLWKNGKEPLYQKVAVNLSEDCAYEVEENLISFYQRRSDGGCLMNLSTGGRLSLSGITAHNKGIPCKEDAKINISNKLKEYYLGRVGPRKGVTGERYWKAGCSNKLAWSNLHLFYPYYLLGVKDRAMARVFPQVSRMVFKSIFRYFKEVGDPLKDQEWITFRNLAEIVKLIERPFFIKKAVYPEGFENSERILDLFNKGFMPTDISRMLSIPIGPTKTIINKIKKGWKPSDDKLYRFALERQKTNGTE